MPAAISLRTALEYAAALGLLVAYFSGAQLPGTGTRSSSSSSSSSSSTSDFHGAAHVSQDKREFLVYPDPDLACPAPAYDARIVSSSPLVVYIDNFLTDAEASHLVDISEGLWAPSPVLNDGHEAQDAAIRKSERARIPRDHTVQCIEARALAFQGWPRHTFIERLWTQRYGPGGHYAPHYDWASADPRARRASSFMVYLAANCSGGGTRFPLLPRPADSRWCAAVDCDDDGPGVTFRPRPRAAVYWENFDADGRGWTEGLHAALPVTDGVKVGLNIWSSYQRGLEPEHLNQQQETREAP